MTAPGQCWYKDSFRIEKSFALLKFHSTRTKLPISFLKDIVSGHQTEMCAEVAETNCKQVPKYCLAAMDGDYSARAASCRKSFPNKMWWYQGDHGHSSQGFLTVFAGISKGGEGVPSLHGSPDLW